MPMSSAVTKRNGKHIENIPEMVVCYKHYGKLSL